MRHGPVGGAHRDLTQRSVTEGRIRGTRVMVSVILDNPAAGVPHAEIMKSYPAIQEPDIQAALAYAAELAREGTADLPLEHII